MTAVTSVLKFRNLDGHGSFRESRVNTADTTTFGKLFFAGLIATLALADRGVHRCRVRHYRSISTVGCLLVASVFGTTAAVAQQPNDGTGPKIAGLVAGLMPSRVSASFDQGPSETNGALALFLGARINPAAVWPCRRMDRAWCNALTRFTVTPHLAYGATHARGLNPATDSYAFSFLDLPGFKFSYQLLDKLRLSALIRGGRHTAERFAQGDIVNYWTASGKTVGLGFEIPLVGSGRGIEFAMLRSTGAFDTQETRTPDRSAKVVSSANLPYRAVVFQIGWSGPFTGVSIPWR